MQIVRRGVKSGCGLILHGIVARGKQRLFVDIDAFRAACTQFQRGHRQYARAAAIVDDRVAGPQMRVEPTQAQARGRMGAGAECKARIQPDIDGGGIHDVVPGRHHPQARRDLLRRELGLRQAHPILVAYRIDVVTRIRRQGRGTFVNDYAAAETTFPFSMFHNFEGQRISGHKRARLISRVQATAEEAARLGLRRGDEIIRVDRVREHQGQNFMTEVCLLPAKLFTRLPEEFGSYRLSALAQLNSIMVGRADERVDIALATTENASDLDVPEGAPLLRLDRVIFSDHEDPIEWRVAHCFLRNERYLVRFD